MGWGVACLVLVAMAGAARGQERQLPDKPDPGRAGKFFQAPEKIAVTGAPQFDDASVRKVVHVSVGKGDDANDGSADKPVRTLGRGLELAKASLTAGEPTKVLLAAGVYREPVNAIYGENDQLRTTPLIIEGEQQGSVILSGSRVWRATWQAGEDGTQAAAWPVAMKPAAMFLDSRKPEAAIGFRRECVYVDGKPLKQVMDRAELAAGCFWIDDANQRIVVKLAAGTDLGQAVVEYAAGSDDGENRVKPLFDANPWPWEGKPAKERVALRKLVFQHSNARYGNFTMVRLADNSLVEDCVFQQANCGALAIASNTTVRRCNISDVGSLGIFTWGVQNIVIEDSEFRRNNWRGLAAGYTGWFVGAVKSHHASNMIVRNLKVEDNYCVGLWWDLWCYHILIENCTITGQEYEPGLLLELTRYATVRNCRISGNLEGIRLHDSGTHVIENVELRDNLVHVMAFGFGQGWGSSSPGQRGDEKGEKIYPVNMTFKDCGFVSVHDPQRYGKLLPRIEPWLHMGDYGEQLPFFITCADAGKGTDQTRQDFFRTLKLENTTFVNEGGSDAFILGPNGGLITYPQWKAQLADWKVDPNHPLVPQKGIVRKQAK